MFLSALSVLAVLAGCSSGGDYDMITASDIQEEGDLTKIAYDFKIHPLKSADPLDGIGGVKSWGDVMLARTSDDKKILRFDNYQLTAVLDRLGRGPGEYYFIEDFSYDEANNCIYIENDSNLVTYDATTMEFKGKQGVNISIQNCLNLGDQMLFFGTYLDERNRSVSDENIVPLAKVSMILVDRDERDLKKGVVLYREGRLRRMLLGYPELFYVNPKNRSTCFTGYVNTIVTFDDEKATPIYSFKLGSDPVDEEADNLLDIEEANIEELNGILQKIAQAYTGPRIGNVFNIMVDEGTISFRVTYSWPDMSIGMPSDYLYFVRHDNKTKVYKHLRIPGLSMDVNPTGANGNHQIAIIENLGELAIDESVPLSPLAEQIVAELKKQNDDNPVMLEFRFK